MNVEKMRSKLTSYCRGTDCCDCKLQGEICRCGRGTTFMDKTNDIYVMTDDEIIKAYAEIFGVDGEKVVDMVNHPKHYNREGAMECIEEMIVVFGLEATYHFCRLNAWKYRYRQNDKGGQQDIEKSDNYIRMAAELKVRMKQEGIYDQRTENL